MLYNMNWIPKHFPKHKGVSYNVNQMTCYSLTKRSLWQLDMPFICTNSSMDRVACAIGPSVPHPQLIFPSKTWFLGIYLNFQWQKSFKNQYFSHDESKSYQINSIKSCSSRSFQQHQRHIPIPPIPPHFFIESKGKGGSSSVV